MCSRHGVNLMSAELSPVAGASSAPHLIPSVATPRKYFKRHHYPISRELQPNFRRDTLWFYCPLPSRLLSIHERCHQLPCLWTAFQAQARTCGTQGEVPEVCSAVCRACGRTQRALTGRSVVVGRGTCQRANSPACQGVYGIGCPRSPFDEAAAASARNLSPFGEFHQARYRIPANRRHDARHGIGSNDLTALRVAVSKTAKPGLWRYGSRSAPGAYWRGDVHSDRSQTKTSAGQVDRGRGHRSDRASDYVF